jgi:hypothetical protein
MIDRCCEVAGRDRPFFDLSAVFLGGADHLAMPQTAAGQHIDMTFGQWLRPSVLPCVPILRRAAELAHREHQHVVEQAALFEVAHQRRDEVVEQRQQRPESLADAAVGRNVVAVRVPGAEAVW